MIINFLTETNNIIKNKILKKIIKFLPKSLELINIKNNILQNQICQEKNYDIIRQKTTEVIIPTKSAIKAANNTKRVFFTFIVLVYKAIVYKVVSVEPIIVEAINPIKESTPYLVIMSVATAIEALPEIGLKIARGKISEGILKIIRIGLIRLVIASMIPDSLKTLIERNSPKRVGKILYIIFIPSFAPSKKLSKTLFFQLIHMR